MRTCGRSGRNGDRVATADADGPRTGTVRGPNDDNNYGSDGRPGSAGGVTHCVPA